MCSRLCRRLILSRLDAMKGEERYLPAAAAADGGEDDDEKEEDDDDPVSRRGSRTEGRFLHPPSLLHPSLLEEEVGKKRRGEASAVSLHPQPGERRRRRRRKRRREWSDTTEHSMHVHTDPRGRILPYN